MVDVMRDLCRVALQNLGEEMTSYNVSVTFSGAKATAVADSDDLSVGQIYFAWRCEKVGQEMKPDRSGWIDATGHGRREAQHSSDVTGEAGDTGLIVVNAVFNDTAGVAVGGASQSILYPGGG